MPPVCVCLNIGSFSAQNVCFYLLLIHTDVDLSGLGQLYLNQASPELQ